jgi:ribosomal protein S18 acetylase RimI-like enzyme
MGDPKVRRATHADVGAVLNLWVEMMTYHAGLDDRFRPAADGREHFRSILQKWMADDRYSVWVAEVDGQLVGYTIGRLAENPPVLEPHLVGHVSDICVAPAWRRRGVARRLFAAVRAWLLQQGVTTVQLHVATENPAAQAFWREMGFSPFMTRMWLHLGPQQKESTVSSGPMPSEAQRR